MHKHIAKQDQEGTWAVERDGKMLLCPKLMYPTMRAFQKTSVSPVEYATDLNRLPCTTNCPFAEMTKNSGYIISCEGGRKIIGLDEVKPFKKIESPL